MVWLAIFAAGGAIADDAASKQQEPPAALLGTVRQRMAQNLAHLPNYTCLQTIERTQRRAPSRRFTLLDTVRLEVALVNGKELFSWPGEKKFEDKEISEIVSGGAIGNGNFALHAKSVFLSNAPRFTFAGPRTRNNRETLRWDFDVPRLRSGYTLRVGPNEAIVGYHGSFWVDPQTLDLIRLEVEAEQIPPQLHLARASDSVDYMRADIGGSVFLLPQSAELVMTDDSDSDNRNRTTFSSCRQYTGESTLLFTDPAAGAAPKAEPQWIELPAGLQVELVLETPVTLASSAVGDPITAVLERPIKKGGVVLVPKGALIHGRITLLRAQTVGQGGYAVGLRFLEIESGALHAKLRMDLEQIVASASNIALPGAQRYPGALRAESVMLRDLRNAGFGGVFFVKGSTVKLARGLRMIWRTVPQTFEDQQ